MCLGVTLGTHSPYGKQQILRGDSEGPVACGQLLVTRGSHRKSGAWRPPVVTRMIKSSFLFRSEGHCAGAQTGCRHLVPGRK